MSYNGFSDLVGGDRKEITGSVLKDIDDRLEKVFDAIWEPDPADVVGGGAYYQTLNNILRRHRFDVVAAGAPGAAASPKEEAKEQLKFLYHIQEILAKAQGSYLGEDLKSDIGDQAETARDRIKQDPKDAFGPGNRQLAYKVSSALKLLLKDFGDQATGVGSASSLVASLKASEDKISSAIALLAQAIATKNSGAHRSINRLS